MKVVRLWYVDWRQNWRDPISMASLIAPLAIAGIVRFLLPILSTIAEPYFNLYDYYPAIIGVVILLPSVLSGMLNGFLMLDERDDGTLYALQVTPLSRSQYAIYRLLSPIAIGIVMALLMIPLMGVRTLSPVVLVFVAVLSGLGGPIWVFSMYALAENKIEGLAILKFLNLLIILPLLSLFIPMRWLPALWPLPFYWPFRMVVSSTTGAGILELSMMWVAGIAVHFIYLLLLHRRLMARD